MPGASSRTTGSATRWNSFQSPFMRHGSGPAVERDHRLVVRPRSAPASTAAVPRIPLREIMVVLLSSSAPSPRPAPAMGLRFAAVAGRAAAGDRGPRGPRSPARNRACASIAVIVAAMRWRASASSANTSICIAL